MEIETWDFGAKAQHLTKVWHVLVLAKFHKYYHDQFLNNVLKWFCNKQAIQIALT